MGQSGVKYYCSEIEWVKVGKLVKSRDIKCMMSLTMNRPYQIKEPPAYLVAPGKTGGLYISIFRLPKSSWDTACLANKLDQVFTLYYYQPIALNQVIFLKTDSSAYRCFDRHKTQGSCCFVSMDISETGTSMLDNRYSIELAPGGS